ncbi:MAG TPA: CPBP family glutamic-type intramembrane protease [Planctomycetota bacterium]|nr:CPBP family glutamic-type intramembrane protease [Planctomycetota bacterium]
MSFAIWIGLGWLGLWAAFLPALVPRRARPPARPGDAGRLLAGAAGGGALWAVLSATTHALEGAARSAAVLGASIAGAVFLAVFLRRGDAPARPLRAAGADVARGAVAYLAFLPLVVALDAAWRPSGERAVSEAVLGLAGGPASLSFWFVSAALVVAVPCFEELFGRGALQPGLEAALRPSLAPRLAAAVAVVTSSLAFTALHEPSAWATVFVLSLLLGAAAARSASVAPAIGFHAAHNASVIAYELWLREPLERLGLM